MKNAKYEALRDVVSQYYEKVRVYNIVIASTGLVHQRTLQCLMCCGMPKKQAKGLCKWMSNRNIVTETYDADSNCRLFNFPFEGLSFTVPLNI